MLKEKAAVCNIGYFDNEIDIAWLNQNYGNIKVEIKPQEEKYAAEDKDAILLVEGRLVNLGYATGYPSFARSNSFAS